MSMHGKVLDLFDERFLNLQDVAGEVEPLPHLVPYDQWDETIQIFKIDMPHDVFLGIFQDYTDRSARVSREELWTWLVQWKVDESAAAPASKKPRINDISPQPPSADLQQQLAKPHTTIKQRFFDPDLVLIEEMQRTLIDIVQAPEYLVPNFIEFLYLLIDYYEGDGASLQCAMRGEIPSLWDFEIHPVDVLARGENEGLPTGEKKKMPSLRTMEELAELSDRLQYKEKRYGMRVPETAEVGLKPLVNIPKQKEKQGQYFTACYKSRQIALALLAEAGIQARQVNNYYRMQPIPVKETSSDGSGDGMKNYFRNKVVAQSQGFRWGRADNLKQRYRESLLSKALAQQARQAMTEATLNEPEMSMPSGRILAPPPLIPPTPAFARTPTVSTTQSKWDKIANTLPLAPEAATFIRACPPLLFKDLKTDLIAHLSQDVRFSLSGNAMQSILERPSETQDFNDGETEEGEEDEDEEMEDVEDEEEEPHDQTAHMRDVDAEARLLPPPRPRSPLEEISPNPRPSSPSSSPSVATAPPMQPYTPIPAASLSDNALEALVRNMTPTEIRDFILATSTNENQRSNLITRLLALRGRIVPAMTVSQQPAPQPSPYMSMGRLAGVQTVLPGMQPTAGPSTFAPQLASQNMTMGQPNGLSMLRTNSSMMMQATGSSLSLIPQPPPSQTMAVAGTSGAPMMQTMAQRMQAAASPSTLNPHLHPPQNIPMGQHGGGRMVPFGPQQVAGPSTSPALALAPNNAAYGNPLSSAIRNPLVVPGGPLDLHYRLPAPGINRRPPVPIQTADLDKMKKYMQLSMPSDQKEGPEGVPVLIYFKKVVAGRHPGEEATDALMLGYIPHDDSCDIQIEHAVFTRLDLVDTFAYRDRQGGEWTNFENYFPRMNDKPWPQPYTGDCERPRNPHSYAYQRLSFAHSIITSTLSREEELTKRWKVTPSGLMGDNRGSIWEGYGVSIDKRVLLSKEERMGGYIADLKCGLGVEDDDPWHLAYVAEVNRLIEEDERRNTDEEWWD